MIGGKMKFKGFDHYLTGVAVPVSALVSEDSCGVGEFLDLEKLGLWCQKCGIEFIQLLPVNDTGFQTSPYSALSAYALHPIYIRIEAVSEFANKPSYKEELDQLKAKYSTSKRVEFYNVLNGKVGLLKKIYDDYSSVISEDQELKSWVNDHPWIIPYGVYNLLKEKNNHCHWKDWPELKEADEKSVRKIWDDNIKQSYFYVWVQYQLEKQFAGVSKKLDEMGLNLKGDIPILMNEDSADVWYNRKYFDAEKKAGAPPDMFSTDGQNWGFPVYKWEDLKKDDYCWWKNRLKQADKFYHAYRIDHVLGFFRIWEIFAHDRTGSLGYFNPYHFITKKNLIANGFDTGRIRWLSHPHINGYEIHFPEKEKARIIRNYLTQIDHEDLYNLNPELYGEEYIYALEESDEVKTFLLNWYKNRTLIEIAPGKFQRNWKHYETKAFKTLSYEEKMALENVFTESEEKSEKIWSKNGSNLLSMMKETTDMLMCAEDLGVVPACVPKVLKKLETLSLKIERWTREYKKPSAPYISVKKYPVLSVCTPAVHDTTTIRGWWEEDLSERERLEYFQILKLKGTCPSRYTDVVAKAIINRSLEAKSVLTVFQLQDLLFLCSDLKKEVFKEDRINVPGTVNDSNWTYRFPINLEDLINSEKFNILLKGKIDKRRQKKVKIK